MDEFIKMATDKGIVIKATMKTERRTYTFEVVEAKNSSKYIEIVEKSRLTEDDFNTQRIRIFQENIREFTETLSEIVKEIYPFNVLDVSHSQEKSAKGKNDIIKSPLKRKIIINNNAREGYIWSPEEDAKLHDLVKQGCTIKEMAYRHERSMDAIISRLRKRKTSKI